MSSDDNQRDSGRVHAGVRCGMQFWRSSAQEMPSGVEIVAIHGSAFSVGFKYQFDNLGLTPKIEAWCTRQDLVASAIQFLQSEST